MYILAFLRGCETGGLILLVGLFGGDGAARLRPLLGVIVGSVDTPFFIPR